MNKEDIYKACCKELKIQSSNCHVGKLRILKKRTADIIYLIKECILLMGGSKIPYEMWQKHIAPSVKF